MRIIHIGFPKCSSKTHQIRIFPYIQSIKKFSFYDYKLLFENLKKNVKIKYVKNQIMSNESISGYYTSSTNTKLVIKNFEKYKKKNDIYFLLIKEPSSMLKSVYFDETIWHTKNISNNAFFQKHKFENFDIVKTVNKVKKKFKCLYVCKLESIPESDIYKKLFQLNDEEDRKVKKIFKTKVENKSVNYKNFNNLALKFINLDRYEKFIKKMNKNKFIKSNYFLNFIFHHLSYKIFLQKVLTRFFKSNLQNIALSKEQSKTIKKYSEKYAKYENFVIYENYGKIKKIIK